MSDRTQAKLFRSILFWLFSMVLVWFSMSHARHLDWMSAYIVAAGTGAAWTLVAHWYGEWENKR